MKKIAAYRIGTISILTGGALAVFTCRHVFKAFEVVDLGNGTVTEETILLSLNLLIAYCTGLLMITFGVTQCSRMGISGGREEWTAPSRLFHRIGGLLLLLSVPSGVFSLVHAMQVFQSLASPDLVVDLDVVRVIANRAYLCTLSFGLVALAGLMYVFAGAKSSPVEKANVSDAATTPVRVKWSLIIVIFVTSLIALGCVILMGLGLLDIRHTIVSPPIRIDKLASGLQALLIYSIGFLIMTGLGGLLHFFLPASRRQTVNVE